MKIFFFKSSVKVYQSDTFCYYDIKTVIVFHHILNLQMKRMILKQKWTVLFYKMAFRTKKISLCIIFTLASLCFFSSSRHQYLFLFFLSIFCKIYSQYTDPVQKCATSSVARLVLLRFLNGTVSFVNGIVSFVRGTIWFLHGTVRFV